ncbi:MAG TPA: hypothetical protein DEO54_07900 [Rikenellaceae bacterium]|nr:MAG: hypothetical protein A2X20_02175 [Bacteroidetes bacterium GWE2_40_15]HBZ26146.1 hypothetical protein [Rikenellaceae bacterium]
MKNFTKSLFLLAFLPVLLFLKPSADVPVSSSYESISFPLPVVGEPVPGAEIYIELEPDDEPILNNPTDEWGYVESELPVSPPGTPGTPGTSVTPVINIWVTISEKIILSLNKSPKPFAKYTFTVTTKSGNLKTARTFVVDVKDNTTLKSIGKTKNGPFKQTLPKISAEQFTAAKGKVKVPINIKVELTSVKPYGINDDGIKAATH